MRQDQKEVTLLSKQDISEYNEVIRQELLSMKQELQQSLNRVEKKIDSKFRELAFTLILFAVGITGAAIAVIKLF